MVFDIALGTEMRDGVCYVYPVTTPASIRPCYLEEPSVTPRAPATPPTTSRIPCPLYAPTWVVFQVYINRLTSKDF